MERVRHTDDVIDARMTAIDDKFERVYTEMQTFRDELRETRREMHAGFAQLHAEMQTGFAQLHAQVLGLQRQMIWLLGGFALGLLGLLAAQL
jgi:aspartyl/asparaginyl-tRNA synthetase